VACIELHSRCACERLVPTAANFVCKCFLIVPAPRNNDADTMWDWGNEISIHTVANLLRRGMFRRPMTVGAGRDQSYSL
jgi:hypothetical protein